MGTLQLDNGAGNTQELGFSWYCREAVMCSFPRWIFWCTGFLLAGVFMHSSCLAQSMDKEKMMWRGFIMMESIEKQEFSIEPSEELGWRHKLKNRFRSQHANIQVLAADPLGSGVVKSSGTINLTFNDLDIFGVRPPASKCTHGWVLNKDEKNASASGWIENDQVRITFMRKSHMDAAQGIQQAIARCGADPNCLMQVYSQFKGVLEDTAESFPIKLVVQLRSSCPGVIQTRSMRTSGMNCENEEKTERDDARDTMTELCRPMAFEMDGTYYRNEKGDRISAYFDESDQSPYNTFDDENHPIHHHLRCTVHLSNGPPEVHIYRITEDAPPRDVTDKEEKVLVGEQIKLQGEVVGTGLGEEILKVWLLPGRTLKHWQASAKEAEVIDLTEDDLGSGFVEFAWVDGSFGGAEQTVKYRSDYLGAELEGETRFRVFKPRVAWEKKEFSPEILVGLVGKDNECEMLPGSPAILLEAKVTLPNQKADAGNCIQFVQLVSSRAWFLRRQTPDYNWYSLFFEDHLDTSYPYSGPTCGSKETRLRMQDTPGDPLDNFNSAFDDSRFSTYLMFRPGTDERKSIWVPLKRIDWGWRGSVTHLTNIYDDKLPPCSYRITCSRPPLVYEQSETDSPAHPWWKVRADKHNMLPVKMEGLYTTDPLEQPPKDDNFPGWQCN